MISVETLAIKRIALRMLAACELSFNSGSKGASIETPVRSISMGCVFFGIRRSTSSTSLGKGRALAMSRFKLLELAHVRQFTVEKEISDLLETGFLRHLMNVVTAIHQTGIGIDPADLCFAGDNPGEARAVGWFIFSGHN